MIQIVSLLLSVGSLVCFIMILIPLFQEKGAVHGILGILSCGIYPFIWGWIHATRLNKKQIMLIWTGCIVGSLVLNFVFGAAAMNAALQNQPTP